ncbi:MAG: hypothetical protein MZW92_30455 [Comamonadaceae bacterium]|nr:hypothetical protein [Comamonadaceae bacterium]
MLVRTTGDIIALSPPLIIEQRPDRPASSTRCAAPSAAPPETPSRRPTHRGPA